MVLNLWKILKSFVWDTQGHVNNISLSTLLFPVLISGLYAISNLPVFSKHHINKWSKVCQSWLVNMSNKLKVKGLEWFTWAHLCPACCKAFTQNQLTKSEQVPSPLNLSLCIFPIYPSESFWEFQTFEVRLSCSTYLCLMIWRSHLCKEESLERSSVGKHGQGLNFCFDLFLLLFSFWYESSTNIHKSHQSSYIKDKMLGDVKTIA